MSEKRPLTYDDFWDFKIVSDPQVSPDGSRAAYVVTWLNRDTDKQRSAIWAVALGSLETAQLTAGTHTDWSPRWSPDGRLLAFLSDREGDVSQLFVLPLYGGEARQVTHRDEGVHSPTWAPDSRQLAFVVDVKSDEQKVPSELAWLEEDSEKRKDRPQLRLLTQVKFRFDGRGYVDRRSHIFIIDIPSETGERQLTDGEYDDLTPTWSPDGAIIAFISNRTPNRDLNFAADIWTVIPDSGVLACLTDGTLSASSPAWSPDGNTIGFYSQPEWIATGTANTHLWAVSRAGGDQRDLIPDLDATHGALLGDYGLPVDAPPLWSCDGNSVLFTASHHGAEILYRVGVTSGRVEAVSPPDAHISKASVTPDGARVVCVAATPIQPFDVFSLPAAGGTLQPIVNSNRDLLSGIKLLPARKFTASAADGMDIEGWLIRPESDEASHPLVMHVHGGPHSMYGETFYFNMQVLAGAGLASVYVNPRGSGGYGIQAMRQVVGDWGGRDWEDLMTGLDHVLAQGGLDESRLAITGGSYGGFMTNWAIGHTDRFACAVAVNSISNLFSFFGTSDIGALWTEKQLGGPYWRKPDWYRERSPLTYVERVRTPLLLIHAETDYRCPIEQSEQMFVALRVQGKETEMVRIPNASHGLASTAAPRHRVDRWRLSKAWFDRYFGI